MQDEREALKKGSRVFGNGKEYRIIRVLGKGSNSICYVADYAADSEGGQSQTFLIKELYPLLESGKLTRSIQSDDNCCEFSNVIVPPGSDKEFELHCDSFKRSVEINRVILRDSPLKVSAGIDMFTCGNTLYNVMFDFHGTTMADETFETLGELAERMQNVLSALKPFHKNNLLHLDISPDNIFAYIKDPNRREITRPIALIDYNSTQYLTDIHNGTLNRLSLKPPYTAPEAQNFIDHGEVSYSSDLWSVCAVFLRYAVGDVTDFPHDSAEVRSYLLELSDRHGLLSAAPRSAAGMAISILQKGLSQTAAYRYQSIEEMEADFKELHDRYYLLGITKSTVWESSASYFNKISAERQSQKLAILDEQAFSARIDLNDLSHKKLLLIHGNTGIGKTTALIHIWRDYVSEYDETSPIAVYIPLREYACPDFIRERCLGRTSLNVFDVVSGQQSRQNTVTRFNSILNTGKDGHTSIILLLDGLNETPSDWRSRAISEIYHFSRDERVSIVVTDRAETRLNGFDSILLPPLDRDEVDAYLDQHSLVRPITEGEMTLLQNPMMLSLYVNINIKDGMMGNQINDAGTSLFDKYIALLIQGARKGYQNAARFAVNVVAPVIAGELTEHGANFISAADLNKLTREIYESIDADEFPNVFSEYCAPESDRISGDPYSVKTASAWFAFIVGNILMCELTLLLKTENGAYAFPHQFFTESFALCCEEVKSRLSMVKKDRNSLLDHAISGLGQSIDTMARLNKYTGRTMIARGLPSEAIYMECTNEYGVTYKGLFDEGLTGKGVIIFPNRIAMYAGEIEEGLIWGDGVYIAFYNGSFWHVTIADWENSRRCSGLFKWGTGEVYLGSFSYDNKLAGRGVKVHPNGNIESGFWNDDQLITNAAFHDIQYVIRETSLLPVPVRMNYFPGYLGNMHDGVMVGKGAVLYQDRHSLFYGKWGKSSPHGHGCFIAHDNYAHWGGFDGENANGFGIRVYLDGSIDLGEWVKDDLVFDYKTPET